MANADIYIGSMQNGSPIIQDLSGAINMIPYLDIQQDAILVSGSRQGTTTTFAFDRNLNTGDASDFMIVPGKAFPIVVSWGSNDTLGAIVDRDWGNFTIGAYNSSTSLIISEVSSTRSL